jgi:hypothetical protein
MAHSFPLVNIPFEVADPIVINPTPVTVNPTPVTVAGGTDPTALTLLSHKRQVDYQVDDLIYYGFGPTEALDEDAVWLIYRINLVGGYIWQQAKGAWALRASLEYT